MTQIGLLEGATEAAIDTVRTHSLLAVVERGAPAPPSGATEAATDTAIREAAEAVTAAQEAFNRCSLEEQQRAHATAEGSALIDRAMDSMEVNSPLELRRQGIEIDDDHVYTRLQQSADALRSAAERFDTDTTAGEAGAGSSADEDEET